MPPPLFITYRFGKKFFNESIGLISAIALCLQPIFLAQSTMVLPEMMLALFSMLTLYFHFQKKYLFYFLSAIALVLTKEPGVILILAIATFSFFKQLLNKEKFKIIVQTKLPSSHYLKYGSI